MAVDPRALAQAGVHLEEPVYLTTPADVATAIAWYRTQLGPAALSILLRPRAPPPAPPPPALPPPAPRPPSARKPSSPELTTAPSSTSTPTASTASRP
jgi:hypothetical protein